MIIYRWEKEEKIEWFNTNSEITTQCTEIIWEEQSNKWVVAVRSNFKKELDSVWMTDRYLAESLFDISKNATRYISTKDEWIVWVSDDKTRLNALLKWIKLKWHEFLEQWWNDIPDWIYTLI